MPERAELRETIAGFDPRTQMVLGGMVMAMIAAPNEVTDREWLSETLTRVAARAHGCQELSPGPELERIRAWILEHRDRVLDAAFAVFVRSAEDLEGSGVGELTPERAAAAALVYLAPPPPGN